MTTQIDWQHEIDASFGSGEDQPVGHYVAVGQRAVRRRRRTAVAGGLAAAAVVAGVVWGLAPGPGPSRSDAPVATQGPAPERTEQTEPDRDREGPGSQPSMSVYEEFLDNPATIDADGRLKLSPHTDEVLERVPNPMGYDPAVRRSYGLRVVYRGVEKYTLVAGTADGSSVSMHTNDASGDFAGWLADKVAVQRTLDTDDGPPPGGDVRETPDAWLTLGPGGSVQSATPFVAVRETREDVDLGPGFARDTDRTGVARLQVAGSTEHVAWRVVAGSLEVVRGPGSFASLDAFISWARSQYASGEGMR